jgi:hypothetical protein
VKATAVAVLLAAVLYVGLRWGTFAVGGSDSYCYVHQAERWAFAFDRAQGRVRLQVPEPLALEAPWPDASLTFAPAGHIPSPTVRGATVPICPAGLSIVMAPFLALGGVGAVFLVVPLFGVLLVWSTYVAGSRFGARIGLASAALVACSPIVLFQLVQPMSDVPAAALWMAAVAAAAGTRRGHGLRAGLASAAAIVMRPNLAPLAIPIAVFLALRPERTWSERVRAALSYVVAVAPGPIAVALIQQAFYGSPLSSGYGSLEALFSQDHLVPNTLRYASWMTAAHTPVWLLAAAAPLLLPGHLTALLVSMVLVNVACYLPYAVFDDWWYLRFLLPAVPLVLILVVACVDSIWRRITRRNAAVAVAVAAAILAVVFVSEARRRDAFRLHRLEARYERAGTYVNRRLPPNAVVITSWESGSVRFYGRRATLVWDSLDPAWLDRAVGFLRARGLEPYLLFETREEPVFRQRFAGSRLAALDWPPMAEVASVVRIYRPEDQERYDRGTMPPTEYIR